MAERKELVDCLGLRCPEPVLRTAKAARALAPAGGLLEIKADDAAFPIDLKSWCRSSSAELLSFEQQNETYVAVVRVPPRAGASLATARTVVADAVPADAPVAAPVAAPALAPIVAPGAALAMAATVALTAPVAAAPIVVPPASPFAPGSPTASFDLRDLPVDALDEELAQIGRLRPGTGVTLLVVPAEGQRAVRWCASGGHDLLSYTGGERLDLVLGKRQDATTTALAPASAAGDYDCALLVLHNDLESLLGALLVANCASAQGMRTMIFFTFWGLNVLRADRPNLLAPQEPVSLVQKLFKLMMPKGPRRQGLGQLNFGGAGAAMLGGIMQDKQVQDLPALIASAKEQNVCFMACTMSMTVMGITKRDLEPYANLQFGGAATFVETARHASLSLVF